MNTMHPTIQSTKHFGMDNAIRRYVSLDVYNRTGIPMDRFIQQPHYVNELIYDAILDRELAILRKTKHPPIPPK